MENRKKKKIIIFSGIVSAIIILCIVFRKAIVSAAVILLLVVDVATAKVEVNTDVSQYNRFMGGNAEENYRNKMGMEEVIFPDKITEDMDVQDYKMVYYNPWDPQYLSYLEVQYDDASYAAEVKRLQGYPQNEYLGYYGAEGFCDKYELLAMAADPYHGFIYALTDEKNTIVYVEILFCNYFMDLKYEKYIDKELLPVGFDATQGNPYQKAKGFG